MDENVDLIPNKNIVYSNENDNSWQNADSYHSTRSNSHRRNVWSRGSRERRDIFDQIESFMSL